MQFAAVTAGISTIALAGGATGVSIIDSGTGPTATLRGILGESGVLTASVVADDVVISVDAGGISTAKIADDAVTEAKIAPFAAVAARRANFTFGSSSPIAIGAAVPADTVILRSRINVTTAFTPGAGATAELGQLSDPDELMTTAQNNLEVVGLYEVSNDVGVSSSTQYNVTLVPGSAVAGDADASLEFIKVA